MDNIINNEKLKLVDDKRKLLEKQKDLKDEITKIKAELEKYKSENNNLKNELAKANKIIKSLQEENNNLKKKLNFKENEINQLKLKLKNNNQNEQLFKRDEIMVINFISTDCSIQEGIACVETDTFAEVEEKLYQIHDNFRDTNNEFIFNGRQILRFKKLKENNIKNGDKVILIKAI